MNKNNSARNYILREVLKMVAVEAALLVGFWVLYQRVSGLRRFNFSDDLFVLGTVLLLIASTGMMNRPFEVMNSPFGVWALPVQDSEEQKRYLAIATLIEQRSFGLRLAFLGATTLLTAVILYFLKV